MAVISWLSPGTSEEDENYNLPWLGIQKFFPKKKCFAFYLPTEWKRLSELENLHDDELDSDFVQQETEFCSFIFSSSKAKALPGGIEINGACESPAQSCLIALESTLWWQCPYTSLFDSFPIF